MATHRLIADSRLQQVLSPARITPFTQTEPTMTISEIASGLYRRNSTKLEYALCLANYKKLDPEQKMDVQRKGQELFLTENKELAAA